MTDPRVAAWRLLCYAGDLPLRDVERRAARAGLDPRDRALLRRLVATEIRRRATLRRIAHHLERGVRGRLSPELRAHVRIGLVQLLFLDRVPDHAAVSETLDAVARTVGGSKVRVVRDALARAIELRRDGASGDPRRDLPGRGVHLAEPVFRDPAEHPLLWAEDALSVPAHLVKRWTRRYGREEAERLARAALEEPPLSLRVAAGAERGEVLSELSAAGAEARPARTHERIVLVPPGGAEAALASAAFREGRVTVQGEAALRAAELLCAEEGERALDLCAAPGGKTAVLAERGARVLAADEGPRRLRRARETAERLGVAGRVALLASDAAGGLAPEVRFDAVLVDAPCSNTAVLAARPEARWRFGPASLASLGAVQERLLEAAAARTGPGGRLVWSTCSLEPEENEQLVRRFLREHPRWELEEEVETRPRPEADGPADGGWAARLRRPVPPAGGSRHDGAR